MKAEVLSWCAAYIQVGDGSATTAGYHPTGAVASLCSLLAQWNSVFFFVRLFDTICGYFKKEPKS